jgi:hypothetical protein
MASADEKKIPEWLRFTGFILTVTGSAGGSAFLASNRVTDTVGDRLVRIEEQGRYLSSQVADVKESITDYSSEAVRVELLIRKNVKPECLR